MMTTAEIAAVLARAGWVRSSGTSEGFLVTSSKRGVIVSWTSNSWNARTMERMLKNYENTLRDYQVTRHSSHLVVTGRK